MNTLDLFMSGRAASVAAANVAARESTGTPERSSGPSGSGAPPQPPMPGFPPAGAATPVPATAPLPIPAPHAVPPQLPIKIAPGRAPAKVATGSGAGAARAIQPTIVALNASADADSQEDALADVDDPDEGAPDIEHTGAGDVNKTKGGGSAVIDVVAPTGDDAEPGDDADASQGDDEAPRDDANAPQGDDAPSGDDLDDIQAPAEFQKPKAAMVTGAGVAALSQGPLSISLVSAATDAPGHARHFLVSLRAHNDPGTPLCAVMQVEDWRSAADIGTALSTALAPLISEYIALLPARQLDANKEAVVKPTAAALKPPSKPPATPASKTPATKSPAAKPVKPIKAAPLDALTLF